MKQQSRAPTARWWPLLVPWLVACEPGPVDPTPPDGGGPDVPVTVAGAGLFEVAERFVPLTHAVEFHLFDDTVLQTVSGAGVQVYALGESSVTLRSMTPDGVDPLTGQFFRPRCASVVRHAPTKSILCAAADADWINVLEDTGGAELKVRLAERRPLGAQVGLRDLALDGDVLYAAAHDVGLLRARLDATGLPGPLEAAWKGGSVAQVEVVAGRVWVLDRAGALVSLVPGEDGTLAEAGRATLAGPPIDLAVGAGRAAVSLGSQGVAVYDIAATTPVLVTTVHPRAVATSADVGTDRLAVGTLTGLYLYDLRGESPRLAGFEPARQGMLDVKLRGEQVVVSDWDHVRLFGTNLDGDWFPPDFPSGLARESGLPVTIPVFHAGDGPQRVRVATQRLEEGVVSTLYSDLVEELTLEPGLNRVTIEGPRLREGARRPGAGSGIGHLTATVTITPVDLLEANPMAWQHWKHALQVILREATDPFPPSVGDTLPPLVPVDAQGGLPTLPMAGGPSRLLFFVVDCALQWPQLEDAAWLRANVEGTPPLHVMVQNQRVTAEHPSLQVNEFGRGLAIPFWLGDFQGFGTQIQGIEEHYGRTYGTLEIRGPDATGDYVVDGAGVVQVFERMYRGAFPLTP